MRKSTIRTKKERLETKKSADRKILEKRVEEGIKRVLEEYREVFKKLAEYDRA